MIVLGLDTSTRATAVGLLLADGSLLQARDDPEGEARPGHATRLLPLAHSLLADAGLVWGEVERIAVGVGPGTFTGLRIGVATARGLAQSSGIELVGVSSLRALAHAAVSLDRHAPEGEGREASERDGNGRGASEEWASEGDGRPPVLAVIDARRGEVFAAAYHAATELVAPAPLAPADLPELRKRADSLAGSPTWTALGDGAVRYRRELEDAGAIVPHDLSPLHRVDARAICELGLLGGLTDAQVLPDYRRRPDAEIASPPESALQGAPS
jgi:tRNA threonylcarbamoyladenosine biosynthesis protein TsaB